MVEVAVPDPTAPPRGARQASAPRPHNSSRPSVVPSPLRSHPPINICPSHTCQAARVSLSCPIAQPTYAAPTPPCCGLTYITPLLVNVCLPKANYISPKFFLTFILLLTCPAL
eukprot:EG_transcript_47998